MLKINSRRPICNNNPATAPMIGGKPFILCWRCSGAAIGILLAVVMDRIGYGLFRYVTYNLRMFLMIMAILIMPATIDHTMNRYKKKRENNKVRFVTGIMLGYAIGLVETVISGQLYMK